MINTGDRLVYSYTLGTKLVKGRTNLIREINVFAVAFSFYLVSNIGCVRKCFKGVITEV